jgi:hypothetical protein
MKWVLRLLRWMFFIPQPRVTNTDALEIARRECERQGWGWRNPFLVEQLRTWHIWAMGDMRPSPYIVVDQQTGEVVRSGCPPR